MIAVDGRHIYINRGDTGAITIKSSGYSFGSDDRCVFTVKSPDGSIVKQVIAEMTNGAFDVAFLHNDTVNLASGDGYTWGVTYYVNPYYDDAGNITNGNLVYTPTKEPMPFTIWQRV